jgi:hypothetical protein
MRAARLNYLEALKHIQYQILDTEGATDDSTLISVLFLGAFDKLTSDEKTGCISGEKWGDGLKQTAHLDGALELVKLRGQKQFDGWLGKSLFWQLSSAVLTNCLERDVELPVQFVEMRSLVMTSRDTSDVRWRLEELMGRLICLKACLKIGKIWGKDLQIMSIDLDNKCLELSRHLDNDCEQIPPLERNKGCNINNNGTESTTTRQRILNNLFVIRLILAEIIQTTLVFSNAGGHGIAICNTIYKFATESTFSIAPRIFFFPLYLAARSQFCPWDLKEQIKDLLNREKSEDAMQVLQLLETKENGLVVEEEHEMNNPWKEFAEQGLGDLSIFGVF